MFSAQNIIFEKDILNTLHKCRICSPRICQKIPDAHRIRKNILVLKKGKNCVIIVI